MILLTGATGTVGVELLPRLIDANAELRVLIRDPQDLGSSRVDVQIALGDLADATSLRHATREVETVVHMAGTFRDQDHRHGGGTVEEVNGLATASLIRAAEEAGAKRFIFLSCLGAEPLSPARVMRSKAAAEAALSRSSLTTTTIATSVIHSADSIWEHIALGLCRLPVATLPSASRGALIQPVAASDVASAVFKVIESATEAEDQGATRVEIAGSQEMDQFSYISALAMKHHHRSIRLPLSLIEAKMRFLSMFGYGGRLPTDDELELLTLSSRSDSGPAGLRELGIEPTTVNPLVD